ncbi:MAG: DUF1648 domain-containing protein [Nocardioides sp.]|nr:DUF1648 domain-containing protein [Nocardioides sp.]
MDRLFFGVTILAGVVATGFAWFDLPDRVPMHFGGSGAVDQWGSRTQAVVTMGCILAGLSLLFWLLAIWVPRAPETLLNIPARDKEWWLASPGRRQRLNTRIATDLYILGGTTILFFVVIELLMVRAAHESAPALGGWFWVVLAVYLVGVLGYSGYMITVRYRRPRDADDG